MDINIKLISNDSQESINVENVDDSNCFSYVDSDNANNEMSIYDSGIDIIRECKTHKTILHLRTNEKSFITIITDEGNILFDAKVLAFERNNDIITLVYRINEEEKQIVININGSSI